jgi:outer membrane cobalamin receptor
MRFWVAFFLLFWYCQLHAQQATISGTVTDASTGEKLPGVTILTDTIPATVTDISGFYQLTLASGSHQLTFKFLGLESKTINVTLAENETKTINVSLSPSAKELGTVVVSAGRFEQRLEDVTVSMNVIKPKLIESTNVTIMDDFMNQIPGVNVTDGQVNIRGGSGWSYGAGSRVLVLVDDMPLLAADANDVKWNFIPVENLEQVEVIKGAASALYGSSALNGIINFRTAYPKSTPVTKAIVYTGFYDTPKRKELKWWGDNHQMTSGYSIFHSEQLKQNDLVVAANFLRDDGFRMGEDEEHFRFNTSYRHRFKKAEGLSAGLRTNSAYTHSGIFFIWANDSTGALIPLGGLDTATTTLSISNTTRHSIDPFISYVGKNGTSHKLNTRYFTTINKNNTNQASTASMYFAEYQFQKKIEDVANLTAGVADNYSDVVSELYGNHNGNNLAAFIQADIHYKKLSLSLGGRIEKSRIDTIEGDLTPVIRTGLNFHIFKETYLRTSYGQGYRFPSVAEKYVSTEVGGVRIYPNDTLSPETGWSAELGIMQGIKIAGWKGYLDVAVFQNEYKDMMEFVFGQWGAPSSPGFGLGFKSLNIGNTRIKGLEVALSGTGNIGKTNMDVLVGYSYIDPRQTNFDLAVDTLRNSSKTNILKYRYRHLFKADVECTIKKFSAGISVRYNSFMENIDKLFEYGFFTSLPPMKEYREKHNTGDTVWDFRCGYQVLANVRSSFLIKNIFNHEYVGRPYDMQPPRTFTLQFSLTL